MSTFIPRSDSEFDSWQENFINKVDPVAGQLGIPEAAIELTHTKQARWATAYKAAKNPDTRNKVLVVEKNEARDDYESNVRGLNNTYLMYNPALTDAMRIDMGLPIHKTTHTPVPPPQGKVDFTLEQLSGSRIGVYYHAHDEERGTKNAKPFGVHGVELAWAILDTPPSSYAELVHSVFDTRSPYVFQFDLSDAGKHFYCCLRWENTTGQKGPWSETKTAIIP
jgi:hypothetical protein